MAPDAPKNDDIPAWRPWFPHVAAWALAIPGITAILALGLGLGAFLIFIVVATLVIYAADRWLDRRWPIPPISEDGLDEDLENRAAERPAEQR